MPAKKLSAPGSKLDEAFVRLVERPIHACWGEIAYDVPEPVSNADAIELAIDADRLKTFSGSHRRDVEAARAADAAIGEAIAAHGYSKMLRFLAKHVRLV
jgi:hypothetical protein